MKERKKERRKGEKKKGKGKGKEKTLIRSDLSLFFFFYLISFIIIPEIFYKYKRLIEVKVCQ